MKLNDNTELFQTEIPSNKWLTKDTDKEVIRAVSVDVADPENLTPEEELVMHKLIDFTRYSQDAELNKEDGHDYLRPAVGLAAPQIGANINMYYIRFDLGEEKEEYAMINAKITSKSKQITALDDGEGCLSVDVDHEGIVPRAYKVVVEGYDYITKEYVQLTMRHYRAIVFQHETEHNEGHLYYDRINTSDRWKTEKDWILI
ncbi:peptide deformylase [[Acholeplasma] multilocale]|uniref:peptide deformylase n=1 Tax=[Acholeplasma] multilocale TaxID=264638 RepID=UPI0009FEE1AD|nr:peptide deformylase [[Acholeplasma] multilocale]